MLRMAKHLIGNGHSISLWHDNWHPLGPLALKFGPRASHNSGFPHDSLVSSILQGNQWVFPTTETIELNEIRNSLPPLTVSGSASIDNIVWTLSSNGKFTISSLWDHMRSHYPTVSWSHVVWFPAHIPKCSLITWLAILNRLNTEDRLVLFGVKPSSCCSLCNDSESHDHLFFSCPFASQVWASVSTKLNVNWSAPTWSGWISLLSSFKGKSLRVTIIKLAFTVTMYQIWIERNKRKFQSTSCLPHVVFQKICTEVRLRVLSLSKLPQVAQASWFVNEWNLSNA